VVDALADGRVGVLGATSLVGACLLPLLIESGAAVIAHSRRAPTAPGDGVEWRQLSDDGEPGVELIPCWICVAPVWVLPDYFRLLEAHGARRVVVLSSTSRFTKDDSNDPHEQEVAVRLAAAEARVQQWAESCGVEWVVLRPTLIYGLGRDKNIAEIARFIRRSGFFPVFGKAGGLRQPIHVQDVAGACAAALQAAAVVDRAYNISGGETLSYRAMVLRVFAALGRRPLLLTVPLWAFSLAVIVLRRVPRYRQWSSAMAQRMNRDLVFDHLDAARDFGFKPRAFLLDAGDLPS
jgi:nucleoside-diphosphate-sugar epimerase